MDSTVVPPRWDRRLLDRVREASRPGRDDVAAAMIRPPVSVWRRLPQLVRDLVAFFILVGFAFAPVDRDLSSLSVPAATVLVVQAGIVVLARRRWPVVAIGIAVVLFVVAPVAGAPAAALPAAVAAFAVADQRDRRTAVIAVLAACIVMVPAVVIVSDVAVFDPRAISPVTLAAAAGALGDATRSRREYILAVTERAIRAEQTRESEAQRRVAEDRLQIARDLHDVVAHQIAVINLHAGVASANFTADPEQAQESLLTVRAAGRSVLTEIGDLLSTLRNANPEELGELAPVPGLRRLEILLKDFADLGLVVTAQTTGDLDHLEPAVDIVTYRVIQEGLTNAHKHGTGQVSLSIQRSTDHLQVTITNPLATGAELPGGGHGLRGLGERIESVRGKLTTNVDHDHFCLKVDIPLHPPEPTRTPPTFQSASNQPSQDKAIPE